MPTIALAMQRVHPRVAVVLAVLLVLAAAVAVVVAAVHGVTFPGTAEAMSYGGKTGMSYG